LIDPHAGAATFPSSYLRLPLGPPYTAAILQRTSSFRTDSPPLGLGAAAGVVRLLRHRNSPLLAHPRALQSWHDLHRLCTPPTETPGALQRTPRLPSTSADLLSPPRVRPFPPTAPSCALCPVLRPSVGSWGRAGAAPCQAQLKPEPEPRPRCSPATSAAPRRHRSRTISGQPR
jgi:hypothetical protein